MRALELAFVEGLDIAPMVLVEVGEAVVEQDGWVQVVGKRKTERAHGFLFVIRVGLIHPAVRRCCVVLHFPVRSLAGVERLTEDGRVLVARYSTEGRALLVTVCVIYHQFLYLQPQ